jgi:hypothetical protein
MAGARECKCRPTNHDTICIGLLPANIHGSAGDIPAFSCTSGGAGRVFAGNVADFRLTTGGRTTGGGDPPAASGIRAHAYYIFTIRSERAIHGRQERT